MVSTIDFPNGTNPMIWRKLHCSLLCSFLPCHSWCRHRQTSTGKTYIYICAVDALPTSYFIYIYTYYYICIYIYVCMHVLLLFFAQLHLLFWYHVRTCHRHTETSGEHLKTATHHSGPDFIPCRAMAPNAADGYASDDECPTRPLPMLGATG